MSPHAKVMQQHTYQERPRQRIATPAVTARPRDASKRWAERIALEIEAFEYADSPDISIETEVLGAPRTEEVLLIEAIASHLSAAGNEAALAPESIIEIWRECGGEYRPTSPEVDQAMSTIDGTIRLMRKWYDAPAPTSAESWIESLQEGCRTLFSYKMQKFNYDAGAYREYGFGHVQLEDMEIPPPTAIGATLTAGFCAAQSVTTTEWRRHAILEYVVLRTAPFLAANDRLARVVGIRNLPSLRPFDHPHRNQYWQAARDIMVGDRAEPWLQCLAEAHRRGTDIQPNETAEAVLGRWCDRGWSGATMQSEAFWREHRRTGDIVTERGPFDRERLKRRKTTDPRDRQTT